MISNTLRQMARLAAIVAATAGLTFYSHISFAADPQTVPVAPPFLPGPLADDDTGFEAIFDGKSLEGWKGDPSLWRVEGGVLVGEVAANASLKAESFLVWRRGQPADFELKADYRVSALGNSGLEYRSTESTTEEWALDGYQMDIDGRPWGEGFYQRVLQKSGVDCKRITGQNVSKVILALPGQISVVSAGQTRHVVGSIGTCAAVAQALDDGWNKAHLIVRGNTMIHIINGQLMSMVIDDDPARIKRGRVGLQLHPGGPMKVEFRNIRIKILDGDSRGSAR